MCYTTLTCEFWMEFVKWIGLFQGLLMCLLFCRQIEKKKNEGKKNVSAIG